MNSPNLLERMLAAAPGDADRFRVLCHQVDDWEALLNEASFHSVDSVLHHYFDETGYTLPPALQERLNRWQMIRDLWRSHSEAALAEALEVLNASSVRTAALKGPALAHRLYPDPRIRSSADLDLLVAHSDLDRATAALGKAGYRPAKASQERFLRRYHYHTILSRACPPVIELHFRISDGFGARLPAEEFLSRVSVFKMDRTAVVNILAPEDELLYLSIHAAGHRFLRLLWLYDIKLLLGTQPNLDWRAVTERARNLNVLVAVLFTCELLQQRLEVRIPKLHDGMTQKLRSHAAKFLLSAIARQPESSRRELAGKTAFITVLCDRPRTAARYLGRQCLFILRRRARRHFRSIVPEEWSY